jgi:membrane associated rhomboid family serine protease
MIPLRDVIPSRTFPVTCVSLIVLNAVVFLYERSLSDAQLMRLLQQWGLVSAAFSWPTLVTSMFLHGGWVQLAGSTLCLWILGDNVEDRVGHKRFLAYYLVCGVVAGVTHLWSDPGSPVPAIGASGAVAGIVGGYFFMYPQSRILTLIPLIVVWPVIEVPAIIWLGLWVSVEVLSGLGLFSGGRGELLAGLTLWARIAGLATGAALIPLFRRPERARVEWWSDRVDA